MTTLPSASLRVSPYDLRQSRVLVVDDTRLGRTVISNSLTEAGFACVECVDSGEQALARLHDDSFDLVILDLLMPGIGGIEVCRRMRADPQLAPIPILVQTGLTSLEQRTAALRAGANDLLNKPIDSAELLARVTIQLENRHLIRELQHYRDRVLSELALARVTYEHLLPSPAMLEAIEREAGLALHWQPAGGELGGALWGVHLHKPRRVGFYLLEVPGRGIAAALVAFAMHAIMQDLAAADPAPSEYLAALGEAGLDMLVPDQSISVLYGVFDGAQGMVRYAAAGPIRPVPAGVAPADAAAALPMQPCLRPGGRRAYRTHRIPLPAAGTLLFVADDTPPGEEGRTPEARIWDALRLRHIATPDQG